MTYQHSPGVALQHGDPLCFTTAEGGVVVTDPSLAALWSAAPSATLPDLVARFAGDGSICDLVREATACLVEARLLERPSPPCASRRLDCDTDGPPVSVVVVVSSPRELEFLDECLHSVAETNYPSLELLVVDNDSGTELKPVVHRHVASGRLLRLAPRRCLAATCNAAIAACESRYLLLMNPDVRLHPDAVARLVTRAEAGSNVAAVVPKTRLWRTPAFLNGIGNRVSPTNWGTDNAIGQLDLGQFDEWRDPPSASLTIELISRRAWEAVGLFDESFPAYYEDADWAYRARLKGWTIAAEPAAEAFHIFGGFWDAAPGGQLSDRKLKTAVVGRLRFACKIAAGPTLRTLLRNYASEDLRNIDAALGRRELKTAWAYAATWTSVVARAGALFCERRRIQAARVVGDGTLFPPEAAMPRSYTYRNSPVLTASLIRDEYAPLLRQGKTRRVAELPLGVAHSAPTVR
jgi:glycosyltransferase involved in cell wall biosynthesis